MSCLCVLCVLCGESSSAPPAITYLHPAGAQRGTTAEVVAAGTLDPWPAQVWVSGKGVSAVAGKDKGKFAVTVEKDAEPGVYWLRAHNADGASPVRPFVVGTLPEIAEKEPNDDPKKPQAIDRSVVVNGKLEKAGDVDGFGVTLKKGQTLVASLDANRVLRSPMDAILQVVSADGFVLDENHDHRGLDPQLAFTAPKDGTYLVRVFAFPSQPDSSIRFFGSDACVYRLTLTTGPFADYASPLAVGPNDPRRVRLEGWSIPADWKDFPVAGPKPGESHALVVAPESANPVRVRIERHPAFGPGAKELKPPFSVTGRVEKPGTEAMFTFDGKKGQALAVQVESQGFGLAVNPVVRVLDAEKKQVARGEPGKLHGDTALSFTPAADGKHTVAVADLFGGGGARFAFLLRVATPEPDYDLAVAGDRFNVPPGMSVTVPVKVSRRGGFSKPIEVVAEGLPGGVKFEITQPAKPDPNTVTVTLSADKAAAGSFRLVGKVKDSPEFTRVARAPLAEFDESTPDLWVTVTSAAVPPPPPKKKKN